MKIITNYAVDKITERQTNKSIRLHFAVELYFEAR